MEIHRILHASLASAVAVASSVLQAATPAGAAEKPNVLFIAVDDLNDWIGALDGNAQSYTPNFNRLAARSVNFTRAYTTAPACNPARASLMTGIHPSTSGVYQNTQLFRDSPVLRDAETIPQYFSRHGYRSIARGKIFHHANGEWGDAQSWDEQADHSEKSPEPASIPANGIDSTKHLFDWAPIAADKEEMPDWKTAEWTAQQLLDPPDQPLFLACGIFRPHLPWYTPEEYYDRYPLESIQLPRVKQDDLEDIPQSGRNLARIGGDHADVIESGQWREAVQAYLASIAFADDCLGKVLDALEKSPIRDNTIIVLWSDHGWHLGEKFKWRKFTLWEESARVVFMISTPDRLNAGKASARTVSLLDIYPTLVDLCGLPEKPGLEGRSLRPLLEQPDADWSRPVLTTRMKNQHSVRSERWRYIQYQDGSEELYDHENDPMEWRNLASDKRYADVIAQHRKWLPQTNADSIPTSR